MIVGYFLVKASMPRYTGMYIGGLILALRKRVFSYNKVLKVLLIFLFWLPLMSLAAAVVASDIVPIVEWNDVFRNYLFGSIIVIFTAKILPIIFLLLADIARVIERFFHLSKKQKRRDINREHEGITRSKFLQYLGFLSGGLVMGSMFVGMLKKFPCPIYQNHLMD